MCYSITKHNLKCDARCLIQLGTAVGVSPYGKPGPCNCTAPDPNIKPRLRCDDGHLCCWVSKRWIQCNNDWCDTCVESSINMHMYAQHPHPSNPSLVWEFLPILDGEMLNQIWPVNYDKDAKQKRAPWTSAKMDQLLHQLTTEGAHLHNVRKRLQIELKNETREEYCAKIARRIGAIRYTLTDLERRRDERHITNLYVAWAPARRPPKKD